MHQTKRGIAWCIKKTFLGQHASSICSPVRTFLTLDHKIIWIVWHLTLAKPGTCFTKEMRELKNGDTLQIGKGS